MNENEFLRQQKAAVERMREMNSRSAYINQNPHKMPPVPNFVKVPEDKKQMGNTESRGYMPHQNTPSGGTAPKTNTPLLNTNSVEPQNHVRKSSQKSIFPKGLNIPFLDNIMSDADTALIIGLLLILMSENADKKLLFALVYILL